MMRKVYESHIKSAKSIHFARSGQRIAAAVGSGCVLMVGLMAMLGYFLGTQPGFSIQIEDGSALRKSVFLHSDRSKIESHDDGVLRLYATGLMNAKPTTARFVMDYFWSLNEEENLTGTHVFSRGESVQEALIFTFYLSNITSQDKEFTFFVQLDAYLPPKNLDVNHPYSYLRLATVVGREDGSYSNVTFYGSPNSAGLGTVDGGPFDNRECVSEYELLQKDDSKIRNPLCGVDGNDYCVNFLEDTQSILVQNYSMLPNDVWRFSIIVFLEGNDPDCTRSAPEGCRLSLSAHFGDCR